jgi:hypothetical protein
MVLVNFTFAERFESVVLISSGVAWDLHNWASFHRLMFNPADGSLDLHWVPAPVSEIVHGHGITAQNSDGSVSEFHLVFRDVQFLRMRGAEKAVAFPENEGTLHGVSFVRPGDTAPSLRIADPAAEEFHLFFKFTSGRTLEIGAGTAEMLLNGR